MLFSRRQKPFRQARVPAILLCALMLTGCAQSVHYADTGLEIPDLPASVTSAGRVVTLPEGGLVGQTATTKLLSEVRASELRNARAVNVCKANHQKLQQIYASR